DFFLAFGKVQMCAGDSTLVALNGNYAAYTRWFRDGVELNGTNKERLYVDQTGAYEILINENTSCPVIKKSFEIDTDEHQGSGVEVVIFPNPSVAIEGPAAICLGDDATFSIVGDADYQYKWQVPVYYQFTGGEESVLKIFPDRIPDAASAIVATVTSKKSGCVARDTIMFNVHPLPKLTIAKNLNKLFLSSGTSVSFDWFRDGTELSGRHNEIQIEIEAVGDYFVKGTDQFGCSNTSNVVKVDVVLATGSGHEREFVFPNPVTGSSEVFVKTDEIPNRIEVVDTQGQIVAFSTHDTRVNTTWLQPAVYTIRIYWSERVSTFRVVKLDGQ
ncbi:MAG: T9SS type A sorting domain-containing protein, partial [Bacteroidota bacterium]